VKSHKPIFYRLVAANVFLYFGFTIWRSLFNNFAVEELAVRADQMGLIQALRELPGLVGFWLAFLALILSEMQVLSLSAVVMGLGLIAIAWADSWASLILGTMFMSIGFHAFYPNSSAIALKITQGKETPQLLGILSAAGAMAAVAGTVVVLLGVDTLGYRWLFVIAGSVAIVGGLSIWRRGDGVGRRQKQRIVFRKRYGVYYLLVFLMGSRRHMFTTFAVFLLVQKFGIPAQQTALLLLINNILGMILFRYFGRLVGSVGERWVLTGNFILLIFVFAGYAFLNSLLLLSILFVVDHLLFGFGIAVDSYFRKVAVSEEEITSNLSMAQTINHIAAVIVPLAGGIIWETLGSQATFLIGSAIAVISLLVTQLIRTDKALPTEAPAA